MMYLCVSRYTKCIEISRKSEGIIKLIDYVHIIGLIFCANICTNLNVDKQLYVRLTCILEFCGICHGTFPDYYLSLLHK